MRRFLPLYVVFRESSALVGAACSLGSFLSVLDRPVLDALALRLDGFEQGRLELAQRADLVHLTRAIAEDEVSKPIDLDQAFTLLRGLVAGVELARLSPRAELDANVAALTLRSGEIPIPEAMRRFAGGALRQSAAAHLH